MKNEKVLRRTYQKKFDKLNKSVIEIPLQGWIKTLREIFGMTTKQFANRLGISQPRVAIMEKNEKNLKISTMERIADSMNCEFFYAFIPREKIDSVIYNRAKQKAEKILNKVNKNMSLENQLSDEYKTTLDDIIQEILSGDISDIWEK